MPDDPNLISLEIDVKDGWAVQRATIEGSTDDLTDGFKGKLFFQLAAVRQDGKVVFAHLRFSRDGRRRLGVYVAKSEAAKPYLDALILKGAYKAIMDYKFTPSQTGKGYLWALPTSHEETITLSPQDLETVRQIRQAID